MYLKNKIYKNILPDSSYSSVTEIPISFFLSNSIKGIVIDMDNTLVSRREKIPSLLCLNWIEDLKKSGIMVCMVTNNSDINRIADVATYLGVIAVRRGFKPFNFVLKKVIRDFMGGKPGEIAMIGDQYLTDVLGANLMKMHSIYVSPLSYEKSTYRRRFIELDKKMYMLAKFDRDNQSS